MYRDTFCSWVVRNIVYCIILFILGKRPLGKTTVQSAQQIHIKYTDKLEQKWSSDMWTSTAAYNEQRWLYSINCSRIVTTTTSISTNPHTIHLSLDSWVYQPCWCLKLVVPMAVCSPHRYVHMYTIHIAACVQTCLHVIIQTHSWPWPEIPITSKHPTHTCCAYDVCIVRVVCCYTPPIHKVDN